MAPDSLSHATPRFFLDMASPGVIVPRYRTLHGRPARPPALGARFHTSLSRRENLMRRSHVKHLACAALSAGAVTLAAQTALGVGATNFNEAGAVVNGFQDDFTGNTLNADYLEFDGGNDDPPAYSLDGAGNLIVNGGLN